jgi:hypothetical protein
LASHNAKAYANSVREVMSSGGLAQERQNFSFTVTQLLATSDREAVAANKTGCGRTNRKNAATAKQANRRQLIKGT